jgi:hypothetical protein
MLFCLSPESVTKIRWPLQCIDGASESDDEKDDFDAQSCSPGSSEIPQNTQRNQCDVHLCLAERWLLYNQLSTGALPNITLKAPILAITRARNTRIGRRSVHVARPPQFGDTSHI